MIEGIRLNETRISENLDHSVMMVTALAPYVGYEKAAEIARHAIIAEVTLRESALALGVDASLYDRVVIPIRMTQPG